MNVKSNNPRKTKAISRNPKKTKSIINKKIQAIPKGYKIMDNDKLDTIVLFDIQKHLNKKHKIPSSRIKIGHSIKFTSTKYEIIGKKTYMEISNITKKFAVRTPDIIILDENENLKLVIEQDGRIHKSESMEKKDKSRNNQYTKAGISLIIISTEQLKLEKKAWHLHLDEKLAELDTKL